MFDQFDPFTVAPRQNRLEGRRDTPQQGVGVAITQVQPKERLGARKVGASGIARHRTSGFVRPAMLMLGTAFWHCLSCSLPGNARLCRHSPLAEPAPQPYRALLRCIGINIRRVECVAQDLGRDPREQHHRLRQRF